MQQRVHAEMPVGKTKPPRRQPTVLTPAERLKQQAGERLGDAADCLTVVEAARYCRVHPETVKRWIAAGTLPAFKLGGHWRIRPGQVDEFLKTQGAVA